jgi:catechol 2,3-dioxygenase-like lactoylglutathione lyase family enzyme
MTRAQELDHFVLHCADVEKTLAWYQRHLGLTAERVDQWRRSEVPFPSLRITPDTLIDLIPGLDAGNETLPRGHLNHICFRVSPDDLEVARQDPELVVEETGQRFGARGVATSIYVRDPDNLLVEIRAYS